MAKKLSLLIVAVAVLAIAAPSMASAAEATYPAGTRAPIGQELTGTGKEITLTSVGVGPIICEKLNLNAKITKNNGTELEASGENLSPFQETCYNEVKSRPVTVEKVTLTKLFANEANLPKETIKKGYVTFTAVVKLPAGVTCTFTGKEVQGEYKGTESPTVLKAFKSGGITSTGGCGSATLDGSFTLHGPGGSTNPVVLH